MKTNNYFKEYFPVVFLSLVLVASTFEASAQNRRNSDRGKNQARTEYRNSNKNENRHATAERYQKSSKRYDWDNRNYSRNETRRFVERNDRSAYYTHPQYGRVYSRFDRTPVVLRHGHDNYYYYGNRFYTFRPGIGYCSVDFPRNMYFERLPYACDDVYVNGLRYYRYGNLYFRLFRGGYLVVPSPFEVTISARF